MTDHSHYIEAASAILRDASGRVLLQLRDDFPHLLAPGMWTVPGGHVEPGETPADTIRRELREEMELAIPLKFWKTVTTWRGHTAEINVTQHLYLGQVNHPAEDIPLHEGQQLRFFAADEVETVDLAFGFGPILADYFAAFAP